MTELAALAWPEVAGSVLVVPVGSTEQHGPHLPLSTDTDVAVALAARLAARLAGVLVAPALPYGSSGEHAGFPGTLSIGAAATELVLVELGRSALPTTVERMLLLSAHGGNAGSVTAAVRLLRSEGRDVRAWSPRWPGDAHAGRTETSVQLALDPTRVRSGAGPGMTAALAELLPALRTGGVRAVSPTGVLGDPSGASAAEGETLLAAATEDLVRFVTDWAAGDRQAAVQPRSAVEPRSAPEPRAAPDRRAAPDGRAEAGRCGSRW